MMQFSTKKVTAIVMAFVMLLSTQLAVTSAFAARGNVPLAPCLIAKVPTCDNLSFDGTNRIMNFKINAYTVTTVPLVKENVKVHMVSEILAALGGNALTDITAKPTYKEGTVTKTFEATTTLNGTVTRVNFKGTSYWLKTGTKFVKKGNASTAAAYAALPTVSLSQMPVLISGKLYVPLNSFVNMVGGDVLQANSTTTLYASTKTRFINSDDVLDAKYLSSTKLLVIKGTDLDNEYYTIDTTTRAATKLTGINVNTSEFVVSPDGTKAAYLADETSEVYVYTFASNSSAKVSTNVTEKLELEWLADNDTLFFILGDRQQTISKLVTSTQTLTNVIADSVNYKSQLNVSGDGKKISYLVQPAATGGAPAAGIVEDDENLDFTPTFNPANTEPQLYTYDADATVPAATKVTTSLDNKTFTTALSNGTSVFLSTDTSDETSVPSLSIITGSSLRSLILANVELGNYTQIGDKLIIQGTYQEEGSTTSTDYIYEIDPMKNRAKTLFTIPGDAIQLSLGATASAISYVDVNGDVYIRANNVWQKLTV